MGVMIDDTDFIPFGESLSAEKLYCANCIHCKLIKVPNGDGCNYNLRVRCDAGKWRKKLGEEKVYKYFTVIRRTVEQCGDYVPWETRSRFSRSCGRTSPSRTKCTHHEDCPFFTPHAPLPVRRRNGGLCFHRGHTHCQPHRGGILPARAGCLRSGRLRRGDERLPAVPDPVP